MSLRQDICDAMVALVDAGLNRGASGNISVRDGAHMLITPSGVPPRDLTPDMIARMPLEGQDEVVEGPLKQSVEWRFHRDLLRARPDAGAVVHAHAPWCTVLSCVRKPIPAVHYMIAAFGGDDIPLADYATYGTPELSENIIRAMKGRAGCLMANHGMVVAGSDLAKAMWLAEEAEALAHQHFHSLLIGGAHILSDVEIAETAKGFATYGKQARRE